MSYESQVLDKAAEIVVEQPIVIELLSENQDKEQVEKEDDTGGFFLLQYLPDYRWYFFEAN